VSFVTELRISKKRYSIDTAKLKAALNTLVQVDEES